MKKHPHIYIPKELEDNDEITDFVNEFIIEKEKPKSEELNRSDIIYLSIMTGVDL